MCDLSLFRECVFRKSQISTVVPKENLGRCNKTEYILFDKLASFAHQ